MSRFDYVKYDDHAANTQAQFKKAFETVEAMVDSVSKGRAAALAKTSLEEAYMWAGKAIRDEQIARNGSAPLQEERKDG